MLLKYYKKVEKNLEKQYEEKYEEISTKLEKSLSLENELKGKIININRKIDELKSQLQKYRSEYDAVSNQVEYYEKQLKLMDTKLYYILMLIKKYVETNKITTIKTNYHHNKIWIMLYANLNNNKIDIYFISIEQKKDGLYNVIRLNNLNKKSSSKVFNDTQLIDYLEKIIKHHKTIIKNNILNIINKID
ncbi:hypothetical protein DEFDS_P059 (plasmid) [Deferribacter desulfuricans SSM1]|uniref:Uncharacterized protein n=1 Tax=Deferribacter desulfuricans (strain DSM 14783 / JCM 11476 / NBRC 101012 / SSM1) TaxID=639282 RepID=D3PEP1_DEFDS|nr:hypothetical protein [Deferribacter desulfuricans]BAI81683.1 hypothetical protein DEFDS_P059 [Deferribacter desulfuricans SSM1]